jgi:pimeloyl-ACP methyl ester carboxylesterase
MPFLELEKTKLHYQTYGQGKRIIFAFHGYGQESGHFFSIADALRPDCTLYAFDLFFHGKSKLPKSRMPLPKAHLSALIQQLLLQDNISRFSLIAFSMGGKFALTLIEAFAAQIDKVLLIAPDGIKTNFWYSLATYPGWLQSLFKRTVLRPVPFFKFLHFLDRRKLVDKGLIKFAHWQMESTPKRLRIYKSWTGFSQLTFDIRHIVRLLNQHKIEITLILGEFDKVIPQRSLQIFVKALKYGKLILLKTGHTFLLHDVANYLRQHKELFR